MVLPGPGAVSCGVARSLAKVQPAAGTAGDEAGEPALLLHSLQRLRPALARTDLMRRRRDQTIDHGLRNSARSPGERPWQGQPDGAGAAASFSRLASCLLASASRGAGGGDCCTSARFLLLCKCFALCSFAAAYARAKLELTSRVRGTKPQAHTRCMPPHSGSGPATPSCGPSVLSTSFFMSSRIFISLRLFSCEGKGRGWRPHDGRTAAGQRSAKHRWAHGLLSFAPPPCLTQLAAAGVRTAQEQRTGTAKSRTRPAQPDPTKATQRRKQRRTSKLNMARAAFSSAL